MRITRISKASWFKIKANDIVIYFDPGYTGYFENQDIPIKELNDKADYIFISHFHKDHLQAKALELITKDSTKIFAPISCVDRITKKLTVVKAGDKLIIDNFDVEVVNAYNTPQGHSTRKVHHKGDFVGYILSIYNLRIYHSGDTDIIPDMSNLGKIDIAFLPIGGTFVMDIDEAVEATNIIKPKYVFPMHESKNKLTDFQLKVENKKSAKVFCLNLGESIEL